MLGWELVVTLVDVKGLSNSCVLVDKITFYINSLRAVHSCSLLSVFQIKNEADHIVFFLNSSLSSAV